MELEARGVVVGFSGAPILQGVDLAVCGGEMVGLIGPNGSGKTTLLRALANLRPSQAGEVRYDGLTAAQLGACELARRIAYLAQGGVVHWAMRVESVVALGRLPHRRPFRGPSVADHAAVENALAMTDVAPLRRRTMGQVSGGERMRILLARALAVESETLLADEPTAALDPLHQIEAMELLRRIARQGRSVVVVLHDLSLAARFCDRLILLAHGGVLAQGSVGEVLTDGHLADAYQIEAVRGECDGEPFVLPWKRSRPSKGGAP